MSLDLDEALAGTEPEPVTSITTATVRRCRRHRWEAMTYERYLELDLPTSAHAYHCVTCGTLRDPATSRKARNNRSRGLGIQRKVLARMGLRHIPGSQLLDGENDAFTAECKSGGRFSESDWRELAKQRAAAGTRMPLLVKVETPGPGSRARGTVTVDLDDWVAMYGPVQP